MALNQETNIHFSTGRVQQETYAYMDLYTITVYKDMLERLSIFIDSASLQGKSTHNTNFISLLLTQPCRTHILKSVFKYTSNKQVFFFGN